MFFFVTSISFHFPHYSWTSLTIYQFTYLSISVFIYLSCYCIVTVKDSIQEGNKINTKKKINPGVVRFVSFFSLSNGTPSRTRIRLPCTLGPPLHHYNFLPFSSLPALTACPTTCFYGLPTVITDVSLKSPRVLTCKSPLIRNYTFFLFRHRSPFTAQPAQVSSPHTGMFGRLYASLQLVRRLGRLIQMEKEREMLKWIGKVNGKRTCMKIRNLTIFKQLLSLSRNHTPFPANPSTISPNPFHYLPQPLPLFTSTSYTISSNPFLAKHFLATKGKLPQPFTILRNFG